MSARALPLVLALVLFTACSRRGPFDGTFHITTIGRLTLAPPLVVTIDDGRIRGQGPVNTWSAPIDGDRVGPLSATRMVGRAEGMAIEAVLFPALDDGVLEDLGDGRLRLVGYRSLVILVPGPGPGTDSP